jgi:hypothetical protein
VAYLANSQTVSQENFDWIDGNCVIASDNGVCTFKEGVFPNPPTCHVTALRSDIYCSTPIVSSTTIDFNCRNNAGTQLTSTTNVNISCTRSGTDYRKHATIVGKFENINSSELCQVIAQGNDGEVITGTSTEDIPFKTIVKDNCNNWSNAGNTGNNTNDAYTAKRDSVVLVNTQIRTTADVNQFLDYRVNGVTKRICGSRVSTTEHSSSCLVSLLKDDVLTVRFLVGNNPTLSSSLSHEIQITELPDTESIIKNLSTQKTKCQTKFLSANVTTTGVVSELGFSNLEINKKYSISARISEVSNTINSCRFIINDGSKNVINIQTRGADANEDRTRVGDHTPVFNPATSALTATFIENTICTLEGDGTMSSTYVTLCELPDSVIETTEFN